MPKTDFSKLRSETAALGLLWEDEDFPANDSSVFYSERPCKKAIEWKRPHELCQSPKFVVDDPTQCDVEKGQLGAPALSGCLSVLGQYRGLFYRVVPADQSFGSDFPFAGVFHFRLWWGGEWVEVLVDDRLPVDPDGRLLFSRPRAAPLFWAPLLEKAYAKLHGSYEALGYATSAEVASELSGGAVEVLPVADGRELLQRLQFALRMTTIPTAIAGSGIDNLGLAEAQSYVILGIDQIRTSDGHAVTLVKLRNSAGAPPFTGHWAGFQMTVMEFTSAMDRVEIIHFDMDTCLSEPKLRTGNELAAPFCRVESGRWAKGVTAGGSRKHPDSFHLNPQLLFSTGGPTELLFCLSQGGGGERRVVGWSLYRLAVAALPSAPLPVAAFRQAKAARHATYSNARQSAEAVGLDAGHWALLPTTLDPGQEATFTLRVFSDRDLPAFLRAKAVTRMLHPPITKPRPDFHEYREQFKAIAEPARDISPFQLQELLHIALPNDYMKSCASLEVCRRAVQALESPESDSHRLSLDAFRDLVVSLKVSALPIAVLRRERGEVWHDIFAQYSAGSAGVLKAERLEEALADVGFSLSEEALEGLLFRHMRRDGTLRFGDYVASILHLIASFNIIRADSDVSHLDNEERGRLSQKDSKEKQPTESDSEGRLSSASSGTVYWLQCSSVLTKSIHST